MTAPKTTTARTKQRPKARRSRNASPLRTSSTEIIDARDPDRDRDRTSPASGLRSCERLSRIRMVTLPDSFSNRGLVAYWDDRFGDREWDLGPLWYDD